jgi:hypothetical protein
MSPRVSQVLAKRGSITMANAKATAQVIAA